MIESGRHYSPSQRDLRELITFTSFTHSEVSDEVTPVTKCVKLVPLPAYTFVFLTWINKINWCYPSLVSSSSDPDNEEILAELYVLERVSGHDNFPAFYGAYYLRPSISNEEALWIAMTMCAGGSVDALIRSTPNRSLDETWISYICKKVLQVRQLLTPSLLFIISALYPINSRI
ncbi:hypothetical protein XELAEV_18000463mg [Xenopus laevis]|uniref:Uncharacterized protein n=1 Tax=Xenopus laevis TaxID=8355 RepID=A0A974BPG9_XENLA|nr:hypothetical protein XELAEV_18000463mg [Xenopus laevis]